MTIATIRLVNNNNHSRQCLLNAHLCTRYCVEHFTWNLFKSSQTHVEVQVYSLYVTDKETKAQKCLIVCPEQVSEDLHPGSPLWSPFL